MDQSMIQRCPRIASIRLFDSVIKLLDRIWYLDYPIQFIGCRSFTIGNINVAEVIELSTIKFSVFSIMITLI